MRSATRLALAVAAISCAFGVAVVAAADDLRETLLRQAAIRNGVLDHEYGPPGLDPVLVALGKQLFEETRLSLNDNMACQTCHLDAFSSADGLPNAVGTGGQGEGPERAMSEGAIVPRNTLPLWGRGGPGFETFFWDGKVSVVDGQVISQFGGQAPSDDPLVVAVHLPFVEIREMVEGNDEVQERFTRESVAAAEEIFDELAGRLREDDVYSRAFEAALGIDREQIQFLHAAQAIAAFIRERFALRESRFVQFVQGADTLSETEIEGGLLFFGQGHCAHCHSGPYLSDFGFHAVPFPQIGFGRNGFGVDYGRFNVTHDPADLYAFRTPPLINVEYTAPYGHAGALFTLEDAIRAHFDPLGLIDVAAMDDFQRTELYRRLLAGAAALDSVGYLSTEDVAKLAAFLHTLSFEDTAALD